VATACRSGPTSSVHETVSRSTSPARSPAVYKRPLTILPATTISTRQTTTADRRRSTRGTVGGSGLYGIAADYVGLGDLHWNGRNPGAS